MTTFETFVRVIPYVNDNSRGFCITAECNGRRLRQFTAKPSGLLGIGKWVKAVSKTGTEYLRSARPLLLTADINALGRMSIRSAAEVQQEIINAEQAEMDAFAAALQAAEPAKQSQPQTAAAAPMTAIVL
jgi:hypothetical protein